MNTEKEATNVDESDKQSQLSENGSIQDNQTISSSVSFILRVYHHLIKLLIG